MCRTRGLTVHQVPDNWKHKFYWGLLSGGDRVVENIPQSSVTVPPLFNVLLDKGAGLWQPFIHPPGRWVSMQRRKAVTGVCVWWMSPAPLKHGCQGNQGMGSYGFWVEKPVELHFQEKFGSPWNRETAEPARIKDVRSRVRTRVRVCSDVCFWRWTFQRGKTGRELLLKSTPFLVDF